MTTYHKIQSTKERIASPSVDLTVWNASSREATPWSECTMPRIGPPLQVAEANAVDQDGALPGWKRMLDIGCIVASAPLVLPVFVLASLWVKCSSPGPVFFRQTRIGLNQRNFTILKFRTMGSSAETASHEAHVEQLVKADLPMTKLDAIGDARMVFGGRVLRATGLDELPQLINVLRGEMSLVGPRPCLPAERSHYSQEQSERFEAVPGITGFWQVHGKNRTTFSQMADMDIYYARNRSLWLDVAIIARTPLAILAQTFGAGMRYVRSKIRSVS